MTQATQVLEVWVAGPPRTKGSSSPFIHPKTGKLRVRPASKGLKEWEETILLTVRSAMARKGLRATRSAPLVPKGPIGLRLHFRLPRPLRHFVGGDGVRLRPDAPWSHTHYPDLDKLVRAVGDALTTAGVYKDDGQVADLQTAKAWATYGAGVQIAVFALPPRVDGEPEGSPG